MTGRKARDDEREALIDDIARTIHDGPSALIEMTTMGIAQHPWASCPHKATYLGDAAALVDAGYRKHPEPEPLCYVVLEMREPEPWIEDGPFSRDEAIALAAEHTAQMATLDGSRYEAASVHALTGRKHPEPEWEYGAGYEADNGREMRWFSIGGAAYTVREAAENEVARYDDPQVRLIRRTRPGPWVPVGEGETP